MRLNNKGFTILEVLIVCLIAAILAGMAAYQMRYSGANKFTVAKAEVYEAFTSARNLASMRSECVRVTIQGGVLKTESFTADAGRTCAGPFITPVRTIPDLNFAAENVTITPFSTGDNFLVFNTSGGLAVDQLVTCQMSDNNGDRATIRIYPAIGQIRIQ